MSNKFGETYPLNLMKAVYGLPGTSELDDLDFGSDFAKMLFDKFIMGILTEKQQKILVERYENLHTYNEIGIMFNVSGNRIRQIVYDAFKKIHWKHTDRIFINILEAAKNDPDVSSAINHYICNDNNKANEVIDILISSTYYDKERVYDFIISNRFIQSLLNGSVGHVLSMLEDTYIGPQYIDKNKAEITPIDDLNFSVRTFNTLKRSGINYVKDLISMPEEELVKIKGCSIKVMDEIIEKVQDAGYNFYNVRLNFLTRKRDD